MTGRLVIIRHGNCFDAGEPPRRIGIGTDLPLVTSGHAQAEALGHYFASPQWRVAGIRCSPLRRTRETAEAIAAALDPAPPIGANDLLAEIDHGPDENAPELRVIERIGAEALAAWDRHGLAPPGWIVDREARIGAWRRLLARTEDDDLLLVTSNGAARFALLADEDLATQAAALPSLKLRTGAFGVISLETSGPRLLAWNERP